MKFDCDFLVIGGGSAGFNAARVAASLGLKTTVVDGARELGGLCILRGCMPSKTLLYMADVLHLAQKGKTFGLKIPSARADMKAIHARKKKIIAEFADYRVQALAAGKVRSHPRARAFRRCAHASNSRTANASARKHILIGTGSKVSVPPVPGLADVPFWTSDDVLDLDFIPKSVIVLGGGIVACELAQFLNRIGTRVTLCSAARTSCAITRPTASRVVQQAFVDEGIELFAGTQLQRVTHDRRGVRRRVRPRRQNRHAPRRASVQRARTRAEYGAAQSRRRRREDTRPTGQIIINRWQQTSAPHIYAAGDCAGPAEIVHIAIQQGELAARHAAGVKKLKPVDYSLLLNVVFTDPQLATIGRARTRTRRRRTRRISPPAIRSTITANRS